MEGRAAAAERLVRIDGRDADVGRAISSRYVGVFLSAWPPHDGPETAPIRRSSLREMQHLWSPVPSSVTRDRATGAMQLDVRRVRLRPAHRAELHVPHDRRRTRGGLPGFGSVMTWLPDYGVGIVAFGNLTYTGGAASRRPALEALVKTGGLHPRSRCRRRR